MQASEESGNACDITFTSHAGLAPDYSDAVSEENISDWHGPAKFPGYVKTRLNEVQPPAALEHSHIHKPVSG